MTGQKAGHCHLKAHLHNWDKMGNFCNRPSCIIFYSIPSLTSVFSILSSWLFSVAWPGFFGARGEYSQRLFLTGNTNLKKSQLFNVLLFDSVLYNWARCWWRSWLRHCAISQKVVGSIPEGVIGIFLWHNPSGRTIAPGLTQPLTEMRTRNIFCGVKVAGA